MKKILVITHQLSNTGAPIVLTQLMKLLASMGANITVLAPQHGPLEEELLRNDFRVLIDDGLMEADRYANDTNEHYDFVIANSSALYPVADQIRRINLPVYWWVHEASFMLSVIDNVNVFDNMPNVHFLTVGQLVYRDFAAKFHKECQIFDFGLEEIEQSNDTVRHDRITFILPSTYCYMKGTDIAANAIHNLDSCVMDRCEFIFIGATGKPEYADLVNQLAGLHDNVKVLHGVSREEMSRIYAMSDCVLIPSRQDPMPTIAAEALMLKKICLISDNTGVSMRMTRGEDGVIFKSEDIPDLISKITYVVNNYDDLQDMREKGRILFDKYYSMDIFKKNVISVFKDVL